MPPRIRIQLVVLGMITMAGGVAAREPGQRFDPRGAE
jgi:hypothetical protein